MNDVNSTTTDPTRPILRELGLDELQATAGGVLPGVDDGQWRGGRADDPSIPTIASIDPATGKAIADAVRTATPDDHDSIVSQAEASFRLWRQFPAPQRAEWVRLLGNKLRQKKAALGRLVALECGKIISEGEGEVQEMIDMADFAVGLGRQLYGLSMHSERPGHRMYEQWHPLGPVGVITAFNFPVAVWAWNAMVAVVCGDTCIWKPSDKTPLCSIAVQKLARECSEELDFPAVSFLACGGRDVARWIADDPRVALVSATGSCAMGRALAPRVAERMGRCLLELGGNNGAIILDDADLDLSLRATVFAAVGTAGQRCTTLRRAFVQNGIYDEFGSKLQTIYESLDGRIGSPLDPATLVGPLIDADAAGRFEKAVERAREQGAKILCGGRRVAPDRLPEPLRGGTFVEPTLIEARWDMPIVREETFAPILYLMRVDTLDDAIVQHNAVEQGLSSAIFTSSLRSAEAFLSASGSDCGIANVNIGTSGAEIGGAFGGEKQTGGGREAGSDAWKAYMRRQTCTINHSDALPLAQGVEFDV